MQENQQNNATIGIPFLFLKIKGQSTSQTKKIHFPTSYSNLMKIAKSIYQGVLDVKALYTEDGILVENLDDVMPGNVLLVSRNEKHCSPQKMESSKTPQGKKAISYKSAFNQLFGKASNQNVNNNKIEQDKNDFSGSLSSDKPIRVVYKQNTNQESLRQQMETEEADQSSVALTDDTLLYDDKASQRSKQSSKSKTSSQRSFQSQKSPMNQLNPTLSLSKDSQKKQTTNKSNKVSTISDRISNKSQGTPNQSDAESFQFESPSNQSGVRSNTSGKQIQFVSKPKQNDSSSKELSPKTRESMHSQNIDEDDGEEDDEEYFYSSEHIDYDEGLNQFLQLFEEVLGDKGLSKKVRQAIPEIDPDLLVTDFFPQLNHFGETLSKYWIQQGDKLLISQGFKNIDVDLYGYDEMIADARCLIIDHRVPHSSVGVAYRFNIAISGSPKSGKSTYLSILARELMYDMVATESYKKFFILPINMAILSAAAEDPEALFHALVDVTINALVWCRPCFTPFAQTISDCFKGITSMKTKSAPKFPKTFRLNPDFIHIAEEFQTIANNLNRNWKDEEAYLSWITSIFYFPSELAKAASIPNIVYIIDEIDALDIELSHHHHFPAFEGSIYLSDILKYMLSCGNYIISARDSSKLYKFVQPIDKNYGSTEFSNMVEYKTLFQIIDPSTYNDKVINIQIDKNEQSIQVTSEHCGGVPVLEKIWDEANAIFDERDKYNEDDEEYLEHNYFAVSKATEILTRLFVSPNGFHELESAIITNVSRTSK